MARRNNELTISLFPFLSILVCMMGVLAFIMVSVAVVSATNPIVELDRDSLRSTEKEAVIVECHADKLLLHPDGVEVSLEDMKADESPFMTMVDRLAGHRDQEYVFFLIFPEGVDCFYQGRDIVESRSVYLGFEPMLKNWQLELIDSRGNGE